MSGLIAAAAVALAGTITQLEQLSNHLHHPNLQPAVNLMQMWATLTPWLFWEKKTTKKKTLNNKKKTTLGYLNGNAVQELPDAITCQVDPVMKQVFKVHFSRVHDTLGLADML